MNDLDPQRVAHVLAREWSSVTDLLGGLGDDDDWARPTRCAGWSIRDLTRHVVWGVSMEGDAVRRAGAHDEEPADGRTMPRDSDGPALLDALRVAADDLVREVRALGPGAESLTCPMPYGATPLPVALDVFLFEAGIHASDFADALGHDRPLTEDTVPSTASVLGAFLPAFATAATTRPPAGTTFSLRGETVRLDGEWADGGLVIGEPAADPSFVVSGDDSSVLLFTVGRLPADDPRLSVTGDAALARDFKAHVPGP
jgi:uncharacterized protein (TIGR03083 family)